MLTMKNILNDEEFIKICNESISMASACAVIGIQFSTFKRRAVKLGCYNTNQSGKGINKKFSHRYELDDIINGQHPQYQSNKLRKRLLTDGLKENKCEICDSSTWLDKPIKLELHHIDGNRNNNLIENIQLLCPNCHSYTDTYKGKNIRKMVDIKPEM
jgi:5-methylcytosine-specific restriction endonuclease McrA